MELRCPRSAIVAADGREIPTTDDKWLSFCPRAKALHAVAVSSGGREGRAFVSALSSLRSLDLRVFFDYLAVTCNCIRSPRRGCVEAFALGTHSRAGAESPVGLLGDLLCRRIATLALSGDAPVHVYLDLDKTLIAGVSKGPFVCSEVLNWAARSASPLDECCTWGAGTGKFLFFRVRPFLCAAIKLLRPFCQFSINTFNNSFLVGEISRYIGELHGHVVCTTTEDPRQKKRKTLVPSPPAGSLCFIVDDKREVWDESLPQGVAFIQATPFEFTSADPFDNVFLVDTAFQIMAKALHAAGCATGLPVERVAEFLRSTCPIDLDAGHRGSHYCRHCRRVVETRRSLASRRCCVCKRDV
eukprot:m51a1_g1880 hypothetical protein (357) ;mRNA; r:689779-691474